MKKIFLTTFLLFGWLTLQAVGGDDDKLSKALQKEYKQQVKTLNKEGWKVMNSAQTVEDAMLSHYLVVQKHYGSSQILSAEAEAANYNTAYTKASSRVAAQYATMKGSQVSSSGNTTIESQAGNTVTGSTKYVSNTTVTTKQKIGNLIPTVTLYRTSAKGRYEVKVLYVVEMVAE